MLPGEKLLPSLRPRPPHVLLPSNDPVLLVPSCYELLRQGVSTELVREPALFVGMEGIKLGKEILLRPRQRLGNSHLEEGSRIEGYMSIYGNNH